MPKPIVPTRKLDTRPYTEAELNEVALDPKKSREYHINVAFNARKLCIDNFLAGQHDKAVNMVNYSDSILELLDAFVQADADTQSIADMLNGTMKAKRDQQRGNRRVP